MNMRSLFRAPSAPPLPEYRYGLLVIILFWLAIEIHWSLALPPSHAGPSAGISAVTFHGDRYGGIFVVLVVLLSHLAYSFKWPPRVAVALRVLSWAWIAFTGFYVLYLSRVLYPQPWFTAG